MMKFLQILLNVPINYTFKRLDRGIGSRGGCGMIISDKFSYRPINLKTNLSNIEAKWIKLKESSIYNIHLWFL